MKSSRMDTYENNLNTQCTIEDEAKTVFLEEKGCGKNEDLERPKGHKRCPTEMCRKLIENEEYKWKFIQTLCICWAFINLGFASGQAGPSFPDLRLIINERLSISSWMFTGSTAGYMCGSFISGVLYGKFNRLILLFVSALGMAVFHGLTPWCLSFPMMLAARTITGLFGGGLHTGGNSEMIQIWHTDGRSYMQALHFAFAIGGTVAPLLTEPFLSDRDFVDVLNSTVAPNTADTGSQSKGGMVNISTIQNSSVQWASSEGDNYTTGHDDSDLFYPHPTRVHYAYLIIAILIGSSAIPFLILYWKEKPVDVPKVAKTNPEVEISDSQKEVTLLTKIVLLVLLVCIFMTYCCVEDTFVSYLMTFCILQLEWTKETGSFATALFWATFCAFRFAGIFLVLFFRPAKMLFGFSFSVVLSFVCLYVGSQTGSYVTLLIAIAWTGLSMSVLFPLIFSWTEEEIMPVTSKLAGLFTVAASTGAMINPLFMGYLMEMYTPLWFVYLLLGETVLYFLIYFCVLLITRHCSRRL